MESKIEFSNTKTDSNLKPNKKSTEAKIKQKRFFTRPEREECWNNAPFMLGRDPDRWRLDAFGNPVNNLLKGCFGVFCYEYDHIVPFSKGGISNANNCQILNTSLNRIKSNRMAVSFIEFKKRMPEFNWSENELDLIEKSIYGDVSVVDMSVYLKKRNEKVVEIVRTEIKDPLQKTTQQNESN